MTRAEYANRPRKRRPNNLPEDRLFDFMLTRAKIVKGPLQTPCYLWQGSKTKGGGYGSIGFRGRPRRVHRVAWVLKRGPLPDDKEVCHKCDAPACFNPVHLFLGTHTDNMRDAKKKGRLVSHRGEAHGCSKLTEQQVRGIRAEFKQTSRPVLAQKYGLSYSTVYRITTRRLWAHL